MRKIKLVTIIVVSVLTIVILLQNTETVETRILLAKVPMSRALLMMLIFVMGFVVGILVPTYFLRRTDGKAKSVLGTNR